MLIGNSVASAIVRACRWCFGLLSAASLAACGVVESISQATPVALRATSATPSSVGTTAMPSPEPPTAPPIPPASPVPPTATPLSAPATVAAGQLSAPTELATRAVAATPAPSATPIPPPASGAWQTYRNKRAGYQVEHPADWTVGEQDGPAGAIVTTFTGPAGMRIVVTVRPGASIPDGDVPNIRCEQVTVGGLKGTRCFDTISRSTSTTLVGQGKTYTIAGAGKRVDAAIYQRFLDSFAVVS